MASIVQQPSLNEWFIPGFPVVLLVSEVANLFRVNKAAIYKMVTDGRLFSIRIENQIRIPFKAFKEQFEQCGMRFDDPQRFAAAIARPCSVKRKRQISASPV